MKLLFRKFIVVIAASVVLLSSHFVNAQSAGVVANPALSVSAISAKNAKRIFLGKLTVWEDGTPIRPCYVDVEPVISTFYKNVVKRKKAQYDAYWNKKVFSGEGVKPTMFDSATSASDFAVNNKGAICFSDTAVLGGAKVVSIQ